MDNKIKQYISSQSIPNMEFLPLLRTEAPYYGNLNRPAQSAYDLAATVAEIQSWGGTVSILHPQSQTHVFQLYEIGRIVDGEQLVVSTASDDIHSRYGIVVAEAEFNATTNLYQNIVVCTFCPNFIYNIIPTWAASANGTYLYLDPSNPANPTWLTSTKGTTATTIQYSPLAVKTGASSIFFSGTARIFGINTLIS